MKLNADVVLNVELGSGSIGTIIKDDDRGYFLAGGYAGIPFVSEPSRIELNSDFLDMYDVMNNRGNSLGPAAVINEESTILCRFFF